MYKATCSSQAPLALQLQVAAVGVLVVSLRPHTDQVGESEQRELIDLGISLAAVTLQDSRIRSAGPAVVSGGGGPSWTPGSWTLSTTPAWSGLSTDATIETRTMS